MKKWYVITGILVLFLVISMGACSSNFAQVNRLEGDLNGLEVELSSTKTELGSAKTELAGVKAELIQLKATKEISFGNGLKVFDLSLPKGYFGSASGKVQNINSESMKLVYIVVVAYAEDGTLKDVSLTRVFDLYPNEVGDWTAYSESADSYAVYAFGNK